MKLRIGITCHPGFGGSSVVATEVGLALAARGHQIHFISTDTPCRLESSPPNVTVHRADATPYPVFESAPWTLALSSKLIEVGQHLDIIHAHYAIPHAVTAWMAREALGGKVKTVATLHGTDVTLLAKTASYGPITRHALQNTDALTVPSASLRRDVHRQYDLKKNIEVIPNFVSAQQFRPRRPDEPKAVSDLFDDDGTPVLLHVSNLRAVKRPTAVVEVFAKVRAQVPARLVIIGEGPERDAVVARIAQLGIGDDVRLLDNRPHFEALLRACSLFLLPSRTESFGLAALEAMASGVPVIASDVGGLPEVIRSGETGILVAPDDLDGMAAAACDLLRDPKRHAAMAKAARADALERFCPSPLVDRYEALYRRLCAEDCAA